MHEHTEDAVRDPGDIPLSENPDKLPHGTRAEVVKDLKRVAEAEPDKVITRNYYRAEGRYKESAWNRYFGKFSEFKRAAGITLTRHQQRTELHIAKHASVDALRDMNIDKSGWEDKYARPDSKRFQSILVVSDIHDFDCDPFYRRCVIETARRVQPEIIVLNGDIFDLPEFSKFTQDPRDWDVVGRIKWVHEFLRDLREACPDAQIDLLEGNHEFRLLRHLAEATPALRAVLSDLHGFTVSKLLGLEEFEINYVSRSDLTAFTQTDIRKEVSKNWKMFLDAVLGSHYPKDRDKGIPGWNGHHHKHLVWHSYSPIFGPYEWHQLGSGHARAADWCDADYWSNGFLIVHVDTHRQSSVFEYVDVSHNHALIGGRFYQREVSEFVAVS